MTPPSPPDHTRSRAAIETVWRIESPRIIAALTRITGDIGTAEELAQDALVIALERWPADGVPDGPGAWLMATAKHRAIDLIRRRANYARKLEEVGRAMETSTEPSAAENPRLAAVLNLSHFHKEHERFYSSAPLETALRQIAELTGIGKSE